MEGIFPGTKNIGRGKSRKIGGSSPLTGPGELFFVADTFWWSHGVGVKKGRWKNWGRKNTKKTWVCKFRENFWGESGFNGEIFCVGARWGIQILYPKDRINLRIFTGLFMYWIYPMYPIFLQMLQGDKKASSILSHWTWSPSTSEFTVEFLFKTTSTNYFLGTPSMLERTSTPSSLQKKQPPSSWWVGPQVMAKHGGELSVKLNQPGKGSTFRALVVDICGICRWRHFLEEMFGWTYLGRQVGGWQVHELTKREVFGSGRKW